MCFERAAWAFPCRRRRRSAPAPAPVLVAGSGCRRPAHARITAGPPRSRGADPPPRGLLSLHQAVGSAAIVLTPAVRGEACPCC